MPKRRWSLENIRSGFDRFKEEYGRLPTAIEIDSLPYLPSSRQIQREFGGLEKIREDLSYNETHFGKGINRKRISEISNSTGRTAERRVEKLLQKKFHDVFVHIEKIFGPGKNRVDFYVYSPDENFGVDVFYTSTSHDLQTNVNIKLKKYLQFREKIYIVAANDIFTQGELDDYSNRKKNILPANIKLTALNTFLGIIDGMRSYDDPTRTHSEHSNL